MRGTRVWLRFIDNEREVMSQSNSDDAIQPNLSNNSANASNGSAASPEKLGRFRRLMDRWQSCIDTSRKGYYLSYAGLFCVFMLLFVFGYAIHLRGFIWATDGLEQQYMFFILQGEWFRQLLSNIFIDHTFAIPMWTDSLGYGSDYISAISNTIGDPILWLSVFATPENAEWLLNATVPLTLFIAGFIFMGYCSYKQFDRASSLIGCMIYLFGGFSFIAFSQIFMVYSLILGIMVLWGIDKLFDHKSPVLLIAGLFLCFFSGTSDAYVMCLLLMAYCLVRVFNLDERLTFKGFWLWVAKVLGCVALAALLAAVLFVPDAMSILTQDRLGLDRYSSLTYSLSYYLSLLSGFINPTSVGADCIYGFAPLALVVVFGLFFAKHTGIDRKTKRVLRILFIVLTIFLLLPIVGRMMNGFAYPNNRWVWAYALLVSVIVVQLLPGLRAALQKNDRRVVIAVLCYALVCMLFLMSLQTATFYAMLVLLFACLVVMYAWKAARSLFNVSLLGVMAVGVVFLSVQWGSGSIKSQVQIGQAYTYAVSDDASSVVMQLPDSSSQRYDSAATHVWRNGNIANGMLGSTFYSSIYNSSVDEYHTSLGLATSSMNFSYATLQGRTTLEALAGTKYFEVPTNDQRLLPPLYSTKVAEGAVKQVDYSVYQADTVLPLAFVYSQALSRADYDRLSLAQRQDALTQAVVLGDAKKKTGDAAAADAAGAGAGVASIDAAGGSGATGDSLYVSPDELRSYTTEVPSELSITKASDATGDDIRLADTQSADKKQAGVTIDGNIITVTQPNTVLYLNAEIPANTEAYFMCEGINYQPLPRTIDKSQGKRAALNQAVNQLLTDNPKETKLLVSGDGMSQEIWYMNNKHHLYGGKKDWAVNIGYSDEPRHTIAIQFTNPGTYRFSSFGVYADDVSQVEQDVRLLAAAGATDVQQGQNSLTCTAAANAQGGYLYFRIPYAEGWSATVDGASVPIEKANLGFMAVPLDEGTHQVQLTYATPYLGLGAAISVVGVALTVLIGVIAKKRRKKA